MRYLPFCHKINLNQNDSFCGLMPPTLALPFLLREKEAKAYLRDFPLDIPWGLCPRSNRKAVTLPPHLLRKFRASLGDRRGQGNVLASIKTALTVIALENLDKLDSPLGGSKGGPPSAGNPKTRRFLVDLCLLSLHKKVGAVWSAQLHKKHIQLNITKSLHRSCRDFLFILLYPNNLVQTSGISGFSRIVTL